MVVFVGRCGTCWTLSLGFGQNVSLLVLLLYLLQLCCPLIAWPYASGSQEDKCPGPGWNAMCRSCCEYERIVCQCPSQRDKVGYAVPCCRNDVHQCDPCIIHQGCSVFDNCKRCNNGTWEARDDFYISGSYCRECRQGWSGGNCLTCGGVVRRAQGHVVLESYPVNSRCDWTLHVSSGLTMELRFTMLSLESDHSCRYDYVEVRDGDNQNSPVIGRYCGDNIPAPVRSSGDSLHIRFVSDGYNNYDGFSATFREISACSSDPCMNGGICSLDPVKEFQCSCRGGFSGSRCELNPPGCLSPQKPAHGDFFLQYDDDDDDNRDFATSVQYLCYKPYKLSGAPRRTCLPSGTWSGTAPTCIRDPGPVKRSCPPLPQLQHGSSQLLDPDGEKMRVEYFCTHPYVLSGSSERRCRPDGSWSGAQPRCIRACREPKVSKLVRQKVMKPQPPSRKSPLHRLYSSSSLLTSSTGAEGDGGAPAVVTDVPAGFHLLYTSIEYQCSSPLYQYFGSTRRTCLKTGKWSGRHVSCSPVCGKLSSKPQNRSETRWPWHAAVYHHLPAPAGDLSGRTKRRGDTFSAVEEGDAEEPGVDEQVWQLVCSGALVSQVGVVVPAHCVTEPGQTVPLSTAQLRVVLGKHHLRDGRRIQHLQVSEVLVHPNYDPDVFDSDLAVLKLLDKAKISEFISPVCLPRMQGGEVTAQQAFITGWSAPHQHHGPTAEPGSRVAQTGVVELADVAHCERQYSQQGIPVSISDNMLCGRQHPTSPSTVCPSRTGGVVLVPAGTRASSGASVPAPVQSETVEDGESDPVWELLGLVSFGYDLQKCNPGLYTVYTRVTNFKNWIEKNIK
ncbi:inactive serine protease PAMR1 [Astyanax mexicanus]|uniref:inactive serine protease PAMR1 n=1 Tax=Astyanax mexicanus TaxID=7994 RepID=UPI0020CB235D|nr:inactive serine protease PAMR1 [Astyanax mexicanus]